MVIAPLKLKSQKQTFYIYQNRGWGWSKHTWERDRENETERLSQWPLRNPLEQRLRNTTDQKFVVSQSKRSRIYTI